MKVAEAVKIFELSLLTLTDTLRDTLQLFQSQVEFSRLYRKKSFTDLAESIARKIMAISMDQTQKLYYYNLVTWLVNVALMNYNSLRSEIDRPTLISSSSTMRSDRRRRHH